MKNLSKIFLPQASGKNLNYLNKLKNEKEKGEKKGQEHVNALTNLFMELEILGGRIRVLSKEAINATINNSLAKAEKSLKNAGEGIAKFDADFSRAKKVLGAALLTVGFKAGYIQNISGQMYSMERDFSSAREEFFEAKILYAYIKSGGDLPLMEDSPFIDFETYSGALSDFCGELLRKARLDIMRDKSAAERVENYYNETQRTYQLLSHFSFSNKSGIRSKVENLKNYIKNFEDLFYDLKLSSGKRVGEEKVLKEKQ